MDALKATKPFNLEHARAGAPIACANGMEATILKWNSRRDGHPLLGVFGDRDLSMVWRADGSNEGNRDIDLVMTPLGWIDGKPVFVGDELQFHDRTAGVKPAAPGLDLTFWRWPEPEKQYPVTMMTRDELFAVSQAAARKSSPFADHGSVVHTAVANAALRHAIDNGQVIPLDQHVKEIGEAHVQGINSGRAARDMAIAQSALNEALAAAGPLYAEAQTTALGRQFVERMARIDLAAIIAEVK